MTERPRKRSRSRSPYRPESSRRQRSPHDKSRRSHRSQDGPSHPLPYAAQQLNKHGLRAYRPMFALYLDIQKNIGIDDLAEDEVRGRWKSFVNKWNRGELAEGWYDPATLQKAVNAHLLEDTTNETPIDNQATAGRPTARDNRGEEEDEDDEDFGPALPQSTHQNLIAAGGYGQTSTSRAGPTVPRTEDLRARNEDARAAAEEAHEKHISTLRTERKLDRKSQLTHLDDLTPRAEPGTKERQIEKKRLANESNRFFAASKTEGDVVEVRDEDLLGGDSLSELKRMKEQEMKKKTEREIRREEIARAQRAEREERMGKLREKEERTLGMLREIARERFGDGNVQGATLRERDVG